MQRRLNAIREPGWQSPAPTTGNEFLVAFNQEFIVVYVFGDDDDGGGDGGGCSGGGCSGGGRHPYKSLYGIGVGSGAYD
ncbi:hypothetical protein M0802_010324 [Mischocyttarus mexicanus]|nr:hypothetical protein M0802_010324 [Mischocyttarus mexicanus]